MPTQTLQQRLDALRAARDARQAELSKPSSLLAQGTRVRDPVFGDPSGPSAAEIFQSSRGDTIKPVVIRAQRDPSETEKLYRKLQKISGGATKALPLTKLTTPILPEVTKPIADFGHEMLTKPAYDLFAPKVGGYPTAPMFLDHGDPQLESVEPQKAGMGVRTPVEGARGAVSTAINVAWPGVGKGLTKLAVEELGRGALARTAGQAATGAALMGAHGGFEGGLEEAGSGIERAQNILGGVGRGAMTGTFMGGAMHSVLGEALPWAARGMTNTAKVVAETAIKKVEKADLLRDFRPPTPAAIEPALRTEAAPTAKPTEPPRTIRSDEVFSPENKRKFEILRERTKDLEPDAELRQRLQAGEDLTDAEVRRAVPDNETIFETLDIPHPTKPGTTIGAEEKRLRVRRAPMRAPREPDEVLDLDTTITKLEALRTRPGGDEYGDITPLIEGLKRDAAEGRPLTFGRLRGRIMKDMEDHARSSAQAEGIELRRDGVVIVLGGPPGAGKSTISKELARRFGAYEIDADFAKLRLPDYLDEGAPATHAESAQIAEQLQLAALRRGDNIVIPGLARSATKMEPWFRKMSEDGHKIIYVLADLPPEEAAVRAFNRRIQKNRDVPLSYILDDSPNGVGRNPQRTFDILKDMPELEGRTVRLDMNTAPDVPLSERIIEHGTGFDPELLGAPSGRVRAGGEPRVAAPEGVPADAGGTIRRVGGEAVADPVRENVPAPEPVQEIGDVDLFGSPVEAPAAGGPKPWSYHELPTSELKLDPDRFQWKQDVDKKTGSGAALKGSRRYNPEFAGAIDVWRDPADGLDYVINGHHRYNLARRSGVESINVRYIDAKNAAEARAWGAVRNIASGKGTALDVAKFLRDSQESIESLAERGIDLRADLARNGVAIAKLPQDLVNRLVQEPDLIRKAAIVGEFLDSEAQQRAAFREMGKLSERQTEELAKVIRAAGSESVEQETLFGAESMEKALFVEKAKVASAIRDRLGNDKRVFGYVAKEGRAAELERGGNKIDAERSRAIAIQSAQLEELFDRLYQRGGDIGKLMDQAARRVAKGERPSSVASSIYEDIRAAVEREIPQIPRPKIEPGYDAVSVADDRPRRVGAVGQQPAPNVDLQVEQRPDLGYLKRGAVNAYNEAGERVGFVRYDIMQSGDGRMVIFPELVQVRKEFRRKGIATALYDRMRAEHPQAQLGDTELTKKGSKFRQAYDQRRGLPPSEDTGNLERYGRAGEGNEEAGGVLGSLSGAGVGGLGGGAIGGQFGDTPEERRANAMRGAAIGFAGGAVAGFAGGKAAFRRATAPARPVGRLELRASPRGIRVDVRGGLSSEQVNEILTAVRTNPEAPLRYVMRTRAGERIGGGNKLHELFADLPFGEAEPLAGARSARIGAAGEQPDMFGAPSGPAQGGLFGEEAGRAAAPRPSGSFTAKQEEARLNAEFLRKQLDRITDPKARQKVAAQVAELDRIANFNESIKPDELAVRAAAEAPPPSGRKFKTTDGSTVFASDLEARTYGGGRKGAFLVDKNSGLAVRGAEAVFPTKAEAEKFLAKATRGRTGAVGAQPYRELGETDLLNVSKIVEEKTAQERIAQAAEKYRGMRDSQKKTWEESDPDVQKAIDDLLAGDRKAKKPHIARKLTGAQILARRDVVRQNDAMIADLSKQIESKTLPLAEHEKAVELLQKAVEHNDALLSDIITGASQKGRDLNLLKRMAHQSLDHDVWQIQAKRMLGDRPLTDEISAQLRRLVNEAREACG